MMIHRYILRNHIAPFLFSLFVLISVFLLQFFMRFADQIIGKGLDFLIIVQVVIYNLAWMVVLVVPMSVLIATLMAFGNLAQRNEIAVMKSAGISLYRMMAFPLLAAVLVTFGLIEFNNQVYPDANHQARILMGDITRKKPTLSLLPNIFSQDIPNYAILTRGVDPISGELSMVTIYDYSNPGVLNVLSAQRGRIFFTQDQRKLVMDLHEGEIHSADPRNDNQYRKLLFKEHRIAVDAEGFSFEKSKDSQRGDRELSASGLLRLADSLDNIKAGKMKGYRPFIERIFMTGTPVPLFTSGGANLYMSARGGLEYAESSIDAFLANLNSSKAEYNNYWVEIHKKYSIPVACIIFILVGAPLGTMTRKGGFGVACGISLLFFLVYWAFLIGGEKLADRDLISPFWGMWSANILLGALGSYLTFRSAKEDISINFAFLEKLVPGFLKNLLKGFRNEED